MTVLSDTVRGMAKSAHDATGEAVTYMMLGQTAVETRVNRRTNVRRPNAGTGGRAVAFTLVVSVPRADVVDVVPGQDTVVGVPASWLRKTGEAMTLRVAAVLEDMTTSASWVLALREVA